MRPARPFLLGAALLPRLRRGLVEEFGADGAVHVPRADRDAGAGVQRKSGSRQWRGEHQHRDDHRCDDKDAGRQRGDQPPVEAGRNRQRDRPRGREGDHGRHRALRGGHSLLGSRGRGQDAEEAAGEEAERDEVAEPGPVQQEDRAQPEVCGDAEGTDQVPEAHVEVALAAARAFGWEIIASDPTAGRIEAVDTTFWFGFKDDVVVRIAAAPGGSRVDVRSLSRVGLSDVGTNAARIEKYLAALKDGT